MAFSSYDDYINKVWGSNQSKTFYFSRVGHTSATAVAGYMFEGFAMESIAPYGMTTSGSNGPGTFSTTAQLGSAFTSATSGSLPFDTTARSPSTRYLTHFRVWGTSTTLAPATIILTDMLYYYGANLVTDKTVRNFDNTTNDKPSRFNNGAGVVCTCFVDRTATTGVAAVVDATFTCQDGTTGRVMRFLAPAAATGKGQILYSIQPTNSTGTYGSYIGLMPQGCTGIQKLDAYRTDTTATAGKVGFLLHRPICEVPIVAANAPSEREFFSQIPNLPTIDDSACLTLLIQCGGATVQGGPINGNYTVAWG